MAEACLVVKAKLDQDIAQSWLSHLRRLHGSGGGGEAEHSVETVNADARPTGGLSCFITKVTS